MEAIAFHTYVFLGFAGFFAGFVDSIAGGGGLIALPALISAGFPPHLALGTNKLQGSFGTLTATLNYSRKGLVSLKDTIQGIIYTAIGAGTGTIAIQHLSANFLNTIIPVLLFAVFLHLLLQKWYKYQIPHYARLRRRGSVHPATSHAKKKEFWA